MAARSAGRAGETLDPLQGAEGATAPESLRQKDRVRLDTLESASLPLRPWRATEGVTRRGYGGESSQVQRQRGWFGDEARSCAGIVTTPGGWR